MATTTEVPYNMRLAEVPRETFGQRLARSRDNVGISVNQMADILEVSRSSISRWEGDKEAPSRRTVLSYALICNVPIAWLEHGAGGTDDDWLEQFRVWKREPKRAEVTRQYALVA